MTNCKNNVCPKCMAYMLDHSTKRYEVPKWKKCLSCGFTKLRDLKEEVPSSKTKTIK